MRLAVALGVLLGGSHGWLSSDRLLAGAAAWSIAPAASTTFWTGSAGDGWLASP